MSKGRRRLAGRRRPADPLGHLVGSLRSKTEWCRGLGCEWLASRWYLAVTESDQQLVVPACAGHWVMADAWVCPPGGECGGGDHYVATVDELLDACVGALAHGVPVAVPYPHDRALVEVLQP